jgi:hypothetical protein
VSADADGSETYFPEKQLSAWFRGRGQAVPVYCFERLGPKAVAEAYRALVAKLNVDTIILVDGGTDSLMRGDEEGLGTPQEDVTSIAAVHSLPIARKMLVCLGFGISRAGQRRVCRCEARGARRARASLTWAAGSKAARAVSCSVAGTAGGCP